MHFKKWSGFFWPTLYIVGLKYENTQQRRIEEMYTTYYYIQCKEETKQHGLCFGLTFDE